MSNVSHSLIWKILACEKVVFPQQVSLQSKVESETLCSDNTVAISGVQLRDKDYFDHHHILGFKENQPNLLDRAHNLKSGDMPQIQKGAGDLKHDLSDLNCYACYSYHCTPAYCVKI